jgi:hypothetical protein
MANELKHGSVGTELTQTEWEAVGAHVFANQAAGDIMYASTTAQLSRLAKGADNTVLHLASGIPAWSATLAGLTFTTPTISSTGFANANHAHAASNSGGTVAASALSGTSLASGVVTTSATTVGTIATGVWQGTDVGVAYGGTGVSSLTANGVLVGNGASAIGSIDMSTKGHVLIGDGSGNPQMLGVGTNNHVMTADSGETTGVKWAAPAAAAAGSLTGSTLASGVVTTSATTVGVLNAGSITSGFGTIDVGSSSIAAGSFDASNGNLTNVGASGDGWTSDTLTMIGSGTFAFVIAQNSDNALEIKDSAGTLLQVETRPGLTNARFWDFIAPASTVGITGRNDINQHLMRLKAYTCTMADTTTVTGAWEGMMLELGVPTIAHSGSGTRTVTTASSFHVEALIAATDITVTNNRMISTSVADCYLTSAGVWTDTSSTAKVKDDIIDLPLQKVGDLIKQIRPRTYSYNDRIGDDHGRTRYGAVAEEFPDFLRVPGDASSSAVNATVLANFSLVASVYLADRYEQLNERLEAIGA